MPESETNGSRNDAGGRSHPPVSQPVTLVSSRASRPPSPSTDVAAPAVRTFFDPWNSSSTGHQRAENRLSGSTSWRASRNLKLSEQFKGGLDGGTKRVFDTVGAGSEEFGKDGRKANGGWEKGAKGLRSRGQKSLTEVWAASKSGKAASATGKDFILTKMDSGDIPLSGLSDDNLDHFSHGKDDFTDDAVELQDDQGVIMSKPTEKQIFSGLCFYTNGSTAPMVSDHKLKHMLSAHGAKHSIALGRRSVTHVILGTGAGGGLAATKIQKEIARTGGKAVKFITVEWVLESIKAQRRLPESRYSPLKLAPQDQKSVFGMLGTNRKTATTNDQG